MAFPIHVRPVRGRLVAVFNLAKKAKSMTDAH
jgi:hypothetical protein